MSRRTPALVIAAALAAALTVTAALVAATSSGADAVADRSSEAGSIAVYGDTAGLFHVAKNLTVSRTHRPAALDVHETSAVATAINPVQGNDGLLCTDEDLVWAVHGLRTTPTLASHSLSLTGYAQEGASGFGFVSCQGVAVHGAFGLATGDEQGLVQLIRSRGHWKIDRRVQFAGLNEGGQPHRAGWIRFPTSLVGSANVYNAVAIAPKAQSNGSYLAVAVDRVDGALAVVQGVGRAKPRAVGVLTSPALLSVPLETGDAAVSFLPGSPNRAVIATATGIAVLDLRTPAAPHLRRSTPVGNGSAQPASLTLSADGDHLAVAVGGRVYGYRNVVGAVKHGQPFRKQVSFRLGTEADELVDDVGYTAQGRLAMLHGSAGSSTGWALTIVAGVTGGHHTVGGSFHTTQPIAAGSLSVWPGT